MFLYWTVSTLNPIAVPMSEGVGQCPTIGHERSRVERRWYELGIVETTSPICRGARQERQHQEQATRDQTARRRRG